MFQPDTLNQHRWRGRTVVILATGPSLSQSDVERVNLANLPTIAVNDAHRLAPWADMLYACDAQWWRYHELVADFTGERWTQDRTDARRVAHLWHAEARASGIKIVKSVPGKAYPVGQTIHDGGNSTFQALGIACASGAARVILLGLDLSLDAGKSHFFGDHPARIRKVSLYKSFRQSFAESAEQFADNGVEIINSSRRTALECYPRVPLDEALGRGPL